MLGQGHDRTGAARNVQDSWRRRVGRLRFPSARDTQMGHYPQPSRYSPNTSLRRSEISPTVASAWQASRIFGIKLSEPRAARSNAPSFSSTIAADRVARSSRTPWQPMLRFDCRVDSKCAQVVPIIPSAEIRVCTHYNPLPALYFLLVVVGGGLDLILDVAPFDRGQRGRGCRCGHAMYSRAPLVRFWCVSSSM